MKKHTMIMGGTGHLGQALVKTFAEEDHILSVIGRKIPEKYSQGVNYHSINLLNNGFTKFLKEIIYKNGKLDNLIFSQRYRNKGDDWLREIEISLTATKNTIEELMNEFTEVGGKSIVIIGSLASSFIAEEQPLSYHVSKAGLDQMVNYYAVKLGYKGIRVNCVSPGVIFKGGKNESHLKNKKLYDIYKKSIPLGRVGTVQDIANVVAFLCSDMASFITGQNIIVDGGLSLQLQESLLRKLFLDAK